MALTLLAALGLSPATPAGASTQPQVLTGRVVDSAGHPLAGVSVTVDDNSGAFTAVFDFFGCLLTLGFSETACPTRAVTARTDARGAYRVVLPPRTSVGRPGLHGVFAEGRRTSGGPARPTFSGLVDVTARTRALPDVVLWTRPVRTQVADGRVRLTQTLPRGASGTGSFALHTEDRGPFAVPWQLQFQRGVADVDARVFESGIRDLEGAVGGRWAGRQATWRSASAAMPTVGVPTTRGRGCSTYAVGGELVGYPGCPFTDGRLATDLGLLKAEAVDRALRTCDDEDGCETPNALVFDLGELRHPRAVVLRDCRCEVELSVDGAHWLPWRDEAREGTHTYAVVTGGLQPTRYVRVVGDVFTTWHLREVSVWSDPLLSVPPPRSGPSVRPSAPAAPAAPAVPLPVPTSAADLLPVPLPSLP